MVITWGRKSVKLAQHKSQQCQHCNEETPFSIHCSYRVFGMLWIFLTSWGKKFTYLCDRCSVGWELPEDTQAELADIISQEGNPIPFLHRYGLWLFLAVMIPVGAYVGEQDDKDSKQAKKERWAFATPARDIIDVNRMKSAILMFDFTETTTANIEGELSQIVEPTIRLTELGVETLNAFIADAERQPSLSSGFKPYLSHKIPKPSGFIPRIHSFMKTVRKVDGKQYYVNSEGAEVLMLYKAFLDMDNAEFQTFSQYMTSWGDVPYLNSTDCFYIYDRLLLDESEVNELESEESHDNTTRSSPATGNN